MDERRILMALLCTATSIATSACKEKHTATEPSTAATSAAVTSAAPDSPKPKAVPTQGELTEGKTKVAYSIVLPEGIHAVSEPHSRGMVSYRKGQNDFDGYNVMVAIARDGKRGLATGKAAMLTQLEREKATKKAQLLEQGDWGDGWYIAASFVEGGKPHVTMMSRIVKDNTVLLCRADGEGAIANAPAATAKVLVETCKSVVVTSP